MHTSSVDVRPLTSVVRIESNVANAQLTLDGMPITAPFSFTGVEGVIRTLGVVTPQTSGGTTYDFVSWSDGGQATHEIVTPTDDTTFTALFQPAATNVVFSDDFEAARGWTLTAGVNTATSGRWQRGDPQPTSSGGITLAAGNLRGSLGQLLHHRTHGRCGGGYQRRGRRPDVDPVAADRAAGGHHPHADVPVYFAHLNNATSADFFRVRVVGSNGTGQTVWARGGTAANVAGAWTTRTVNISAWAGQTVQLRVDAMDGGSGSVIEAGFDNVVITRQ